VITTSTEITDDVHNVGGLRAWFAVGMLSALYACSFIDRQILALMVEPIKRDLRLTDTQMSILIGPAFAFFFAVLALPMGVIADRFSRKTLIAIGVAAWSCFTAGCGLTMNFTQLLLARMGVGVGEATLGPGAYSMITDYFRAEQLARAMSVFGIGVVVGSGLASLIGGYVIEASMTASAIHLPLIGYIRPWQLVFIVVGLPGLLLSTLLTLLVREPARRKPPARNPGIIAGTLGRQLRHRFRAYAAIMGGFGLFSLFGYGAGSWLPTYLIRVHHLPIHIIGLTIGLATITFGTIGTIAAGSINDRLVARGRIDAPFVVGPVIGVCFLGAGLLMALAPTPTIALAGIVVFSMFGAIWSGITAAALQLMTPSDLRGRVSAVYMIINNGMGLGLGPLLMALAVDHIFESSLAVGKAIALVGVIAVPSGILLLWSGRRQYLDAVAANS